MTNGRGGFGPEITAIVEHHIDLVPDYPKPGVLFRDITPLLADGPAFGALVEAFAEAYRGRVDAVAGLESRGFILGAPVAVALGVGMITVRKAGRLPGEVIGADYSLEYGEARMEVRPTTVARGQRVLVVDDVLATGGTAEAACRLMEEAGAEVAALGMLIELSELGGRERLAGRQVDSVVVV
ncbi:adenine phosphoribosyltransferase [Georgenia sp. Z1344]|uniref:adenine phosphoribosyltransferase n=1 Tax=Georgenia sp. Z1344 TaxID=3416706 RepID=UPI003CE6E6CC